MGYAKNTCGASDLIIIIIMKYQFQNSEASSLNTRARASFVQKVYSILSVQLLVTALFVLLNVYVPAFALVQYKYTALYWVSFAAVLIPIITLGMINDM